MILSGGVVAMPTETVYGLAGNAANEMAVAKIFEVKGRPQFNPLIVHVSGLDMAERYAVFCPLARKLAHAFWPGPLTLVLRRRQKSGLSLLASAGLDTIGLRAPDHPVAQALIAATGLPLAAPSANPSGGVSPTDPHHVARSLGDKVGMILDGGRCTLGVESTIVKIHDGALTLLRPGGVTRKDLNRVTGVAILSAQTGSAPEAPGMSPSHYAPRALLRMNATTQNSGEAYLGFGDFSGNDRHSLNLSRKGDLVEASANLYAHLHVLDAMCAEHNLTGIAVAPIPLDNLGEAVNDRLTRAAAPRAKP